MLEIYRYRVARQTKDSLTNQWNDHVQVKGISRN